MNLANVLFWLYGVIYIVIAGIKFFNARRAKKSQPDAAPVNTGAWIFLLTGCFLMVCPYINVWAGRTFNTIRTDVVIRAEDIKMLPPDTAPVSNGWKEAGTVALLWLAFCFPWLMLLCLKKYRPLRRQAIIGLAMTLAPLAIVMGMKM